MITVLLEFNCAENPPRASVWLVDHPIEEGSDEEEHLPNVPGSTKLIGPIKEEDAMRTFTVLKEFFERTRVPFLEHTIADD